MERTDGAVDLHDGGHLYFESYGKGPALLLVPGLGGLGQFWSPIIPRLAQTHRVVVHDHRGAGKSSIERIRYSVEQMARDVLALMDFLGIERARLVGHSTGGAIGQSLALDHPQRIERLVLSSTWTAPDAYFQRLFTVRKRILLSGGPRHYVESMPLFVHPPSWLLAHPPATVTEAAASAQIPDPEVLARRIDAILAFDRSAELHRIDCPTLVTCARDDIVTPIYFSEALSLLIGSARQAFVPTGGHFYPATAPELFLEALVPFLCDEGS